MNTIHPTAELIKTEWNNLLKEIDECRDGFDDEEVEKSITEGFWSIVNTFDGDITYHNMNKTYATKLLYGVMDEEDFIWIYDNCDITEYDYQIAKVVERLKKTLM